MDRLRLMNKYSNKIQADNYTTYFNYMMYYNNFEKVAGLDYFDFANMKVYNIIPRTGQNESFWQTETETGLLKLFKLVDELGFVDNKIDLEKYSYHDMKE
jgi:hypothetical protein